MALGDVSNVSNVTIPTSCASGRSGFHVRTWTTLTTTPLTGASVDSNIAREIDDLLRVAKTALLDARMQINDQKRVVLIDQAMSFAVRARTLLIKFG